MIKDSDLLAILDEQINNSLGGYSSDLEDEQAQNLDYYYGRPYGDEEDGLSTVVTRDVSETVEWTMPSMMRIFASGDRTVQFDPTGEEDEEQAQQETDYINHVFNKQNDGFMILHNWIKSCLLLKNSYVKVWIQEEEKITTETYEGLDELGLAEVDSQEGVEIIEQDSYFQTVMIPDPMTGMMVEQTVELFDIKIEITTNEKKVCVDNVPNEEIRVSRNTRGLSLKDSPFVAHVRPVTKSELIGMGFDAKIVDNLPAFTDADTSQLEIARNQLSDEQLSGQEHADESMREVEFSECYIRMDMEEKGRAQLWKVSKAGQTILDKEPIDFIPFPVLSPYPMPNQHIGLCPADLVKDIQRIRSVLMRQMLDNLYLSNNPEKEVLWQKVNMDDLLTSRVGGIKRVTQMGSIQPLTVPFTAGASMPMLELLDSMREYRTGIGRNNMGLDADTLAQSTKGAFMGAMEQANQRLEMLARTFAETGIKDLFKMIHELVIKHYDREIPVKLNNKYVTVSPLEWKSRANMTVVVGLGTGNRDAELSQLFTIAEKQEAHLMQGSPLVTPKNLYNTYARLIERADMKNPTLYFTDPESEEAQQLAQQQAQNKKADPNEMLAQVTMKIEQDKAILQAEKQRKEAEQKDRELALKEREMALREHEADMKPQIEAAQIEAKRYEADVRQETALAVEQLKGGAAIQDAINTALGEQQVQNDAKLTAMLEGIIGEMNVLRQENSDALSGVNSQFNQQLQTLAGQLNRPRVLVYDEAGEIIGSKLAEE